MSKHVQAASIKCMSLSTADWENQRAFFAVLRGGSLSAAARELGVAQPTVRRRLEALEQSLGTALFVRSPSGLLPTEAARALGPHVEAMAAAAAAFNRASSADVAAVAGTVRITASEVIGAEVLPRCWPSSESRIPSSGSRHTSATASRIFCVRRRISPCGWCGPSRPPC